MNIQYQHVNPNRNQFLITLNKSVSNVQIHIEIGLKWKCLRNVHALPPPTVLGKIHICTILDHGP